MPRTKKSSTPIIKVVNAQYISHNDGDTCFVLGDLYSIIRVGLIDCAETPHKPSEKLLSDPIAISQYKWGNAARNAITTKIKETSNNLTLSLLGFDSKYNRNICSIAFSDGMDWSVYLVSFGLALVYAKYTYDSNQFQFLSNLQASAQSQKLGIWSDPNFLEPSIFRTYIAKLSV